MNPIRTIEDNIKNRFKSLYQIISQGCGKEYCPNSYCRSSPCNIPPFFYFSNYFPKFISSMKQKRKLQPKP